MFLYSIELYRWVNISQFPRVIGLSSLTGNSPKWASMVFCEHGFSGYSIGELYGGVLCSKLSLKGTQE
jgi:hypothetical protein